MQVQKVNKGGTARWVLLDDDMHLIDPVCEFLEFQRKIDRADHTLRAYATDLKIYWEFLMKSSNRFDQISIRTIADFVDYLRSGTGDEASLYVTSSRTNRSINRIMSSVHRFYRYEQLNGVCPVPVFFETIPEMSRGQFAENSCAFLCRVPRRGTFLPFCVAFSHKMERAEKRPHFTVRAASRWSRSMNDCSSGRSAPWSG